MQTPIKIMPSEFYSLVLEDANGVTYFWRLDGTFDGWDVSLGNSGQSDD